MRQPRCGFKDLLNFNHDPTQPLQYNIGNVNNDPTQPLQYNTGPKWKKNDLTWKILTYSDKLTVNQQRLAIENSFKRWEDASGLNFKETNQTADINIDFTSGNHGDGINNAFDGPGGVLAHAFYPEDGRAHFDDEELWVYHESEGPEIEVVATHELGHSLGLSHTVVRGAIMAPFYQEYADNFPLHEDDILGIQSHYGKHQTTSTTVIPSSTPSTSEPKDDGRRLCDSKIDAIIPGPGAYIHLFIGPYVYKLYENCGRSKVCVVDGYPKRIRSVFRKGPKRVTAAVYVPDHRKYTYLFQGRKLWRYTEYKLDKGYPKQMDKKDLPYKPSAAYIHKNQFSDYQWYIFARKYFWELNMYTETLTNEVMKINTYWDFMPNNPDAIMQTKDGSIYVFKGKLYNKYDHRRVPLDKKRVISEDFLGKECH